MIPLNDPTLTVRHRQKNFLLSSHRRNEVKKQSPGRQPSAGSPAPFEELTERRAAVTVLRLFLGSQLGKCFLNVRKIKQGIVAEAIRAARSVEDDSFRRAAECRQRLAVASSREYADKPASAIRLRNVLQLAKNPRVIGLVVSVRVGLGRLVGGVAR